MSWGVSTHAVNREELRDWQPEEEVPQEQFDAAKRAALDLAAALGGEHFAVTLAGHPDGPSPSLSAGVALVPAEAAQAARSNASGPAV